MELTEARLVETHELLSALGTDPYLVLDERDGEQLTRAFAMPVPSYAVRESLKKSGHWEGYRPAIVFHEIPKTDAEYFGLLLHEVAHVIVPTKQPEDIDPTPEQRQAQDGFLLKWESAECAATDLVEPWIGHGANWMRNLLHCHYRALWQGVVVPLACLTCGVPYGLSPAHRYMEALGAEPFRLRNYSFAEIENEPAPADFTALFESDVAAWNQRKKKRD